MDTSSKTFLTIAVILMMLGGLFIAQASTSGRLRIIFCDIGQGDGILIQTASGKQIIIDSGPGTRIDDCLAAKMPMWDRTVEMMIPSHFQKDHMEGQIEVFAKYRVENVLTTKVLGVSTLATEWNDALLEEGSNLYIPKVGEDIVVDDVTFEVLWPSPEAYDRWSVEAPKDLNETSIVLRMKWFAKSGPKCAYFTGDIPKETLALIASLRCDLLKVPHHGSKTGTDDAVVSAIRPTVAVIQVGKNGYGHPTIEVLDALTKGNVKVLRNDQLGTIELDSELQLMADH